SVVLIDAFLILELGGVSLSPQRITFSTATASASRKIVPILYVSSTLSKIMYTGFFFTFLYCSGSCFDTRSFFASIFNMDILYTLLIAFYTLVLPLLKRERPQRARVTLRQA